MHPRMRAVMQMTASLYLRIREVFKGIVTVPEDDGSIEGRYQHTQK